MRLNFGISLLNAPGAALEYRFNIPTFTPYRTLFIAFVEFVALLLRWLRLSCSFLRIAYRMRPFASFAFWVSVWRVVLGVYGSTNPPRGPICD